MVKLRLKFVLTKTEIHLGYADLLTVVVQPKKKEKDNTDICWSTW